MIAAGAVGGGAGWGFGWLYDSTLPMKGMVQRRRGRNEERDAKERCEGGKERNT